MSDLLQTGGFSRAQTALKPQQAVNNPPQWRYLWLLADVGNQAPLNIWIGTPPNNRAPDLQLGPGQQREQDQGAPGGYSWWIASADISPWSAQYAMDVESIGIDANVVGATTPLQPARTIGSYTTSNGVIATTPPIPIPDGMQSLFIVYPGSSTGPSNIAVNGVQSGRLYPCLVTPALRSQIGAFVFLVPAGGADTTFTVSHTEGDLVPRTVFVDALFTSVIQSVVAAQGLGPEVDSSWDVTVTNSPFVKIATNPVPTSAADWAGVQPASFGPVTASPTTIIAAPGAGIALHVCGWSLTIDPSDATTPGAALVQLKSHTTGFEVARRHYNYGSQTGALDPGWDVTLRAPLGTFPANEALDVVITNAAGTMQVTGTVFYHT